MAPSPSSKALPTPPSGENINLVARALPASRRPCPSHSRHRDGINLGLLRSFYNGGGGITRSATGLLWRVGSLLAFVEVAQDRGAAVSDLP